MNKKTFKLIPGTKYHYVDKNGTVISEGRELKQRDGKSRLKPEKEILPYERMGSLWVPITEEKITRHSPVAVLVLQTFGVPKPVDKNGKEMERNVPVYLDGNRQNTHLSNLAWKTTKGFPALKTKKGAAR
jgi:hypothetical protein